MGIQSFASVVAIHQVTMKSFVAVLSCLAAVKAGVPVGYAGYGYPAGLPAGYNALPAALPNAGVYGGVYGATHDPSVAYANLYPAAQPYVHEEIAAEPYLHEEIAAEPYVHVEVPSEPYYHQEPIAVAAPVAAAYNNYGAVPTPPVSAYNYGAPVSAFNYRGVPAFTNYNYQAYSLARPVANYANFGYNAAPALAY